MDRAQCLAPRVVSVREAIEECITNKRAINLRPYYLKELERYLRKFLAPHFAAPIHSLTHHELERMLSSIRTPGGRNTAIGKLCALFSWAFKRDYIERDPMRKIQRARQEFDAPKILSPSESRDLLSATGETAPDLISYMALGLYAGIRPHELKALDWSAIDLHRGLARIDAAASKVRRRRIVPLAPIALDALTRVKSQHGPVLPVSRLQFNYRRRRVLTALGWNPIWPHDLLRHTAASYLLALHQDAGKVSLWLGNSPGILLRHYHELVSPEDCAKFWAVGP